MDSQPPAGEAARTTLKRWLIWTIAAMLAGCGLLDWWFQRQKERRYDVPILRAAQRNGVSPALVKALVWRESRFNPKARGRAGEIGLMQIRTLAAQEWAQAARGRRNFEGTLFDPETNLQVGTWYLGKLLRRYARTDNPVSYALADYNAGRSNVLRWNRGAAETNSALFISQITFPGTQEYVRLIARRSVKYEGQFARAD